MEQAKFLSPEMLNVDQRDQMQKFHPKPIEFDGVTYLCNLVPCERNMRGGGTGSRYYITHEWYMWNPMTWKWEATSINSVPDAVHNLFMKS